MSIKENLQQVLARVATASLESKVTLVAVSKKKSIDDIIEAYNAGQRHFGENYVQELEEKSNSEKILTECPDIKWHFIGHLQTNKTKKVAAVPSLHVIETVDSIKLAEMLNSYALSKEKFLNIMIQVNTSLEEQKSGIAPVDLNKIYSQIKETCSNLNILGIMTIGSYEASLNPEEINKDFQGLVECKNSLIKHLNLAPESVVLSMGMSHDFETAIRMGSTNVRVGSLIFGSR